MSTDRNASLAPRPIPAAQSGKTAPCSAPAPRAGFLCPRAAMATASRRGDTGTSYCRRGIACTRDASHRTLFSATCPTDQRGWRFRGLNDSGSNVPAGVAACPDPRGPYFLALRDGGRHGSWSRAGRYRQMEGWRFSASARAAPHIVDWAMRRGADAEMKTFVVLQEEPGGGGCGGGGAPCQTG